jgi:hypothetical protein
MPMPSPCQSLILRVGDDTDHGNQMSLGVRISTESDESLSPNTSQVAVDLDFWDDLADVYVVPGVPFTLRYPNRVVGSGEILGVLPS